MSRLALLFAAPAALLIAVLGLIGAAAGAEASQDAQLPSSLKEMVKVAMKRNPAIRLAETKVAEAEAALNQTRLEVTREVVRLQAERGGAVRGLEAARQKFAALQSLVAEGRAPSSELSEQLGAVAEAETRLTSLEAQLEYVVGVHGQVSSRAQEAREEVARAPRFAVRPAPSPAQLAIVGNPVRPTSGDRSLEAIVEEIRAALGEVCDVVLDRDAVDPEREYLVELMRPATVEALATLLNDLDESLVFVFRDYGILITSSDKAETMNAPALPRNLPMRIGAR